MAYYKEIVTKAVIGKGKKTIIKEHVVPIEGNIDNVLGCWVINHKFNGSTRNNTIYINGSYDINIWYSYDNNTKTNVIVNNYNYEESMNVKINSSSNLNSNSEIIVRALNQPSVTNAIVDNNTIKISLESEMGIEVIGDTVVRVSTTDDYDDYEEIIDEDNNMDINVDYLTN